MLFVLFFALFSCTKDPVEEPWIDQGLHLGDVQLCADPGALAYDDIGVSSGLLGAIDQAAPHQHGGSAVMADLDGDGDRDIIMGFPDGPPILYRWNGSIFLPEALSDPDYAFLLNLADMDGDGDLDLLAGGYVLPPSVLLNDGQGIFSPMPMPTLPMAATRAREVSAGDIDGDGSMDLYVLTNSGGSDPAEHTDFVLRGDGQGSLIFDASQTTSSGRGFDAVWVDADGDLDPDIYVVNDDGADFGPNLLLRNNNGHLEDAGEDCDCDLVHFGMGGDAADANGDGFPDYYLTAVGHNILLESQSDGRYVDTSLANGSDPIAEEVHMGWGAIWLDHDNDGILDILVAQGDRWILNDPALYDPIFDSPLNLLQGDGSNYQDIAASLGLNQAGSFRTVIADDINNDGVLDLLATEVVAAPHLYVSRSCTAANWLRVEAPPQSRVEVSAGGHTQVAWTSTESSYGGGHSSFVHFGLGGNTDIDHLKITNRYGVVLEAHLFEARRVVQVY